MFGGGGRGGGRFGTGGRIGSCLSLRRYACCTTTAPMDSSTGFGGYAVAMRRCDYCNGHAAYGDSCPNCGAPDEG